MNLIYCQRGYRPGSMFEPLELRRVRENIAGRWDALADVKESLNHYREVGLDVVQRGGMNAQVSFGEAGWERGFVVSEPEVNRATFIVPFDDQARAVLDGLAEDGLVGSWSELDCLAGFRAVRFDVRVLGRGSILMSFPHVLAGGQRDGYSYQFNALHEPLSGAARQVLLAANSSLARQKRLLSRMLLLGAVTGQAWDVFDLARAAVVDAPLLTLIDMVDSGELREMLAAGVAAEYIASLAGAMI